MANRMPAVSRSVGARECRCAAAVALLLLGAWPADAADGLDHPHNEIAQAVVAAEVKLPEVNLIDQEGRATRFRSDVIGDRIVVMNFIYTSCKTTCPMASAIFGYVQERLGERLGGEVMLVSLTIDPVTDRPARLQAYAAQHHPKPGWLWLTGEKVAVDQVLNGVGAYSANVTEHPAMVLIGDGRTGQWMRLVGFPTPDEILIKVERLLEARHSGPQGSGHAQLR